jgi:hypothetical protein
MYFIQCMSLVDIMTKKKHGMNNINKGLSALFGQKEKFLNVKYLYACRTTPFRINMGVCRVGVILVRYLQVMQECLQITLQNRSISHSGI